MKFPANQRSDASPAQPRNSPTTAAQASPLGDQLFFVLGQIQHEFQLRMHATLAGLGLDVRQYTTLAFISAGHTPAQHDLAKVLHLDPSQVVTLTKGLEAQGLLTREMLPRDRRAKVLVITAEGQSLYAQAAVLVQQVHESLTASLSRRDRNALESLLNRILPLS